MMSLVTFCKAVRESRALHEEQKRELLDEPELLPDEYREHIAQLLLAFDRHSRLREAVLRKRLNAAYRELEQRLTTKEMDETERARQLQVAREQIDAMFGQGPAA